MAGSKGTVGGAKDIYVEGATEFIDRLRTFDRAVYDSLIKELEGAGQNVRDRAASLIPDQPLSGWGRWLSGTQMRRRGSVSLLQSSAGARNLSFEAGKARSKIKTKVGRRFQRGDLKSFRVFVQQMDWAGAIYELAGSRMDLGWGATGGSALFRQNLNRKNGDSVWPRTLTPAFYAEGPKAFAEVQGIIERKKREHFLG